MGLKAEEEGLALETYSQPVKFQSLEKKPLPGESPPPPAQLFQLGSLIVLRCLLPFTLKDLNLSPSVLPLCDTVFLLISQLIKGWADWPALLLLFLHSF